MFTLSKTQGVSGYKLICGYLGAMLMLIGIIVLLPLFMLIPYPNEIKYIYCFIIPSIPCLLIGYLLFLLIKNKKTSPLKKNQDAIVVVFSWIIAILVSTIPFLLSKDYTFIQALFESTSGFTSTGFTVSDINDTSHIFLFFRSITLFVGGIGLVLVVTSVLSGYYGMKLYGAEGHSEHLLPNVLKTARLILGVYSIYIFLGMYFYMIFGMDWFDALNHAIAALATGGFSTRATNIAYYNSLPIEIVSIILMLLGGTNFIVHTLFFSGKFKKALSHCEVKFNILLAVFIVPFFTLSIAKNFDTTILHSFRLAVFNLVSVITTTGFQTIPSFVPLPPALFFCVILLLLMGGNSGSTAGGIKQYRIILILKELWWNIIDKTSFRRIIRVYLINRCGEKELVDQYEKRKVSSFVFLYLLIFIIGTFILTCYGYSISDSMFEISSALSGTGISSGIVSPTSPTGILLTTCACMFLGRLEIYIILLSFIKIFMDIKQKLSTLVQ